MSLWQDVSPVSVFVHISLKGQRCSFVTWAAFYMLTRMRASDCLSLFLRYLLLIGLSDCIGVPLVVQSYRSLLCCISSRKGCFCATLDYRRVPLSQKSRVIREAQEVCHAYSSHSSTFWKVQWTATSNFLRHILYGPRLVPCSCSRTLVVSCAGFRPTNDTIGALRQQGSLSLCV
jgi:hypothetical protein